MQEECIGCQVCLERCFLRHSHGGVGASARIEEESAWGAGSTITLPHRSDSLKKSIAQSILTAFFHKKAVYLILSATSCPGKRMGITELV
jgi:hypothetical protein